MLMQEMEKFLQVEDYNINQNVFLKVVKLPVQVVFLVGDVPMPVRPLIQIKQHHFVHTELWWNQAGLCHDCQWQHHQHQHIHIQD